jgi:hypothetical protein
VAAWLIKAGTAYKGREDPNKRVPEADSGGGGQTQPSPARGRLRGGDDRRAPPISHSGAGEG